MTISHTHHSADKSAEAQQAERIPLSPQKKRKSDENSSLFFGAERGGFEPPKPFWGLLAFQAGQFNHSCISPFVPTKILFFAKFYNKMRVSLKKMLTSHNEQSKWIKV